MPGRGEPLAGYQKVCPVCGKEFYAYGDWSFRRKDKATKTTVYYCSWGCLRTIERAEEQQAIQTRTRCLICGNTEPEIDYRYAEEEIRDCVCDRCKEAVLFARRFLDNMVKRRS